MKPVFIVLPVAAFVVACALGWWLALRGGWRQPAGFAAALAIAGGGCAIAAESIGLWDGLIFAVAALFVFAPAFAGAVLGGALGWWRRRR